MPIKYRTGYKYQLTEDYSHAVPWQHEVEAPLYRMRHGVLTIKAGYAWDGPSGPTFDTPAFMRGSLVHDCLYQMIAEKNLPESQRETADRILRETCLDAGMDGWRAWYVYNAVRRFGGDYAAVQRPILTAP